MWPLGRIEFDTPALGRWDTVLTEAGLKIIVYKGAYTLRAGRRVSAVAAIFIHSDLWTWPHWQWAGEVGSGLVRLCVHTGNEHSMWTDKRTDLGFMRQSIDIFPGS